MAKTWYCTFTDNARGMSEKFRLHISNEIFPKELFGEDFYWILRDVEIKFPSASLNIDLVPASGKIYEREFHVSLVRPIGDRKTYDLKEGPRFLRFSQHTLASHLLSFVFPQTK